MRYLGLVLLLLQLSSSASADNGADELEKLHSALNMLNQQQQAIYQQFQMVREVRLSNASRFYGMPMLTPPSGEIPNYDEMVEAQKNAIRRADVLEQQADQLLARYNEIEAMKKPLQQRIYDLSLKK